MVLTADDGQQKKKKRKMEAACGDIKLYVHGMNYIINSLDAFKWNDGCMSRNPTQNMQLKKAQCISAKQECWSLIKFYEFPTMFVGLLNFFANSITAQNYTEYFVDSICVAAYECGLH